MNRLRSFGALAMVAVALALGGSLVATDVHGVAAQDDQVAETTVDVTEIDPGALGEALAGNPVLAYIGVAGVALSFAQPILTRATWSKDVKMMIGAGMYAVAGAGYWVVVKWQTTEAVLTILGIATVALVWYRLNHGAMDDLRANVGLK